MRVLVTGGRNHNDPQAVYDALDVLLARAPHDTLVVIQGGAAGADKSARDWCYYRHVAYINVPANWERHGKAAGPIRNQRMIDAHAPDLVLAFPGGRGTADMVERAKAASIEVIAPQSLSAGKGTA